jgi:hypothetical protein
MRLYLVDIYGNENYLPFRVEIMTNNLAYTPCKTDSTVAKKPFALDHIYVIGSLWRHKIHIPLPRTQTLIDCYSQMTMIGRLISDYNFLQPFPNGLIWTEAEY